MSQPPPHLFKRLFKNNIFRLSALYSALFLIASIAMLAVAYRAIERNIQISIEREVNAEITRFIGSYQSTQLGIESDPYAYFIEHQGRKVAGNITEIPETKRRIKDRELVQIDANEVVVDPTIEQKGEIIGKTVTLPDHTKLFIGKSSYDETERREDIIDAFSTALLTLLAVGVVGGLIVSFRSIKRIDRISRVSQSIMAGNLDLRVPTTGKYNDDLEEMSRNINNMLDRINDLMQGMRDVSNNVAHDLRTPLTRLRGSIETIARKSEGEVQIEAEQALLETDNLLNTFTSLLRISQVESGAAKIIHSRVDLAQLIREVLDFYDVLAEEKAQTVQYNLTENIVVMVDKTLISQVIVNLFTNAVKYTPSGGIIRLATGQQKMDKINYAVFTIHDSGSGVPEAEIEKLTQRFYRLEKHRNTANGNGLGLPMVKAIIEAHNGRLVFKNDNGLKVLVYLPLTQLQHANF
ncbi:MAG: hypothetical protein CSA47_02105 [Gammaproteobacteria bacterium]|nr:MAG: hypothetical protein CSA47_02105 [Gammaproteobacteria bacterium]